MKIDESQKKNIVILCVLAVVMVGALIYSFSGISTSAAPSGEKTQQTTAVAENQDAANDTQAETASDVETGPSMPEMAMTPQVSRDPFTPQMLPPAPKSTSSMGSSAPVVRVNTGGFSFPKIPPIIPGAGDIQVTNVSKGSTSSEPALDPSKELRLTGIIEGTMNLAIIRGANNTRYIVREGQRIDGKYTVGRISKRSGVSIRYQGREFVLRLGGN